MFSLVTGIYDSYLAPSQLNVLVVGAPGVGKTTLLERFKVTQIPKRPSKRKDAGVVVAPPASMALALQQGGADASSTSSAPSPPRSKPPAAPMMDVAAPQASSSSSKRRFHFCPAPKRYQQQQQHSTEDDDEEFVMDDDESSIREETKPLVGNGNGMNKTQEKEEMLYALGAPLQAPGSPEAPRRVRLHSKEFDMKSLDLDDDDDDDDNDMQDVEMTKEQEEPQRVAAVAAAATEFQLPNDSFNSIPLHQECSQQLDMKPNKKMLPMDKIRPTIGTNLAKIDMCGAKCHFFDVGGRMEALWERYYEDCDAVIFCWKLGDDLEAPPSPQDDNDNDTVEPFDMSKQQELLQSVRQSIPDEIPFLVLGHVFGTANVELVDQLYATDQVLPHYHNPMTVVTCGSAKTGAGLVSAMEWLVPLAKRQQKERLAVEKALSDKQL